MKPASPSVLTINGGSSSIKFALFEAGDPLQRILEGGIERIGRPEAVLRVKGVSAADTFSRPVTAPDHAAAVNVLMDWIEKRSGRDALTAVGHRVVHGGPMYSEPQRITAEMVDELPRSQSVRPRAPARGDPARRGVSTPISRSCPRWLASTPRFTTTCRAWPDCCRSRAATRRRACGGTGSTGCRTRS